MLSTIQCLEQRRHIVHFSPAFLFLFLLLTAEIGHGSRLLRSPFHSGTCGQALVSDSRWVGSLLASFSTDRLAWGLQCSFWSVKWLAAGGRSYQTYPHRYPPSSSLSSSRVIGSSSFPFLCAKQLTICPFIGTSMEESRNRNQCSQNNENQLISGFLRILHQTESQTLLQPLQAWEKPLVSLSELQFPYLQNGIVKTLVLGLWWECQDF